MKASQRKCNLSSSVVVSKSILSRYSIHLLFLYVLPLFADGDIAINMSEVSIRKINEQFAHTINFGGHWKPQECIPKWKVQLIFVI